MSTASVNLLKERVLRAALACVDELEGKEPVVHTKATRDLIRAVKAYKAETWRIDEAPRLIESLVQLVELLAPESSSMLGGKIRRGEQETLLLAKAFLGQREVNDDTTPIPPKHKGPRSKLG